MSSILLRVPRLRSSKPILPKDLQILLPLQLLDLQLLQEAVVFVPPAHVSYFVGH